MASSAAVAAGLVPRPAAEVLPGAGSSSVRSLLRLKPAFTCCLPACGLRLSRVPLGRRCVPGGGWLPRGAETPGVVGAEGVWEGGGGTETKANSGLKLFFHGNWWRRPWQGGGVGEGDLGCPSGLPAQGQGETLLEHGWQSHGVSHMKGWPILPITSASGPVGRSR